MAKDKKFDVEKAIEELSKSDIPKEALDVYKEDLTKLKGASAKEKKSTEWQEMAENVGRGLADIAAGWYGRKEGVGIGPLDIKGTDFGKKRAGILAEEEAGKRDLGMQLKLAQIGEAGRKRGWEEGIKQYRADEAAKIKGRELDILAREAGIKEKEKENKLPIDIAKIGKEMRSIALRDAPSSEKYEAIKGVYIDAANKVGMPVSEKELEDILIKEKGLISILDTERSHVEVANKLSDNLGKWLMQRKAEVGKEPIETKSTQQVSSKIPARLKRDVKIGGRLVKAGTLINVNANDFNEDVMEPMVKKQEMKEEEKESKLPESKSLRMKYAL